MGIPSFKWSKVFPSPSASSPEVTAVWLKFVVVVWHLIGETRSLGETDLLNISLDSSCIKEREGSLAGRPQLSPGNHESCWKLGRPVVGRSYFVLHRHYWIESQIRIGFGWSDFLKNMLNSISRTSVVWWLLVSCLLFDYSMVWWLIIIFFLLICTGQCVNGTGRQVWQER